MSTIIPADEVEELVGARRHEFRHIMRYDSLCAELHILHSAVCKDSMADLRDCPFSVALDDGGVKDGDWWDDEPVFVDLEDGELAPWKSVTMQPDLIPDTR